MKQGLAYSIDAVIDAVIDGSRSLYLHMLWP